jgi:hypothetical protein
MKMSLQRAMWNPSVARLTEFWRAKARSEKLRCVRPLPRESDLRVSRASRLCAANRLKAPQLLTKPVFKTEEVIMSKDIVRPKPSRCARGFACQSSTEAAPSSCLYSNGLNSVKLKVTG